MSNKLKKYQAHTDRPGSEIRHRPALLSQLHRPVRAHRHHRQIDVDELACVFQRSRITTQFVVASPEQCLSARSPHQPTSAGHCPRCSAGVADMQARSEEHTSELQSLMRISYAVFCLKKKK